VQLFFDTEPIGRRSENVLQSPLGDALFALGYQQRPFFKPPQLQVLVDDFTKTVRQNHVALTPALFPDPYQSTAPACPKA